MRRYVYLNILEFMVCVRDQECLYRRGIIEHCSSDRRIRTGHHLLDGRNLDEFRYRFLVSQLLRVSPYRHTWS
jgi:hypothetical protein